MRWFGLTIFLSAFLLFQVQPLVGKSILPWYGSSPAVWTTCLLFFQVLLLAGYVYAHGLTTWLAPRTQALVHALLVGASLVVLPLATRLPNEIAVGDPTGQILGVLVVSVGVPYAILATTGPLLQAWFHRAFPSQSPYRLYALSNTGSLLALISYPVLVERWLVLRWQTGLWSLGYALFVALAGVCAWKLWRTASGGAAEPASGEVAAARSAPGATLVRKLCWLTLSALGSVVLMAVTNQMCQDVAVVPFLWIVPLGAYLVSFILCFEHAGWYRREWWLALLVMTSLGVAALLREPGEFEIIAQVTVYSLAVFAACMCCHGELSRLKPAAGKLTEFFLFVALGGALGGVFVALVAPRIFVYFWELDLSLASICLLTWLALVREYRRARQAKPGKFSLQPGRAAGAGRQRAWTVAVVGLGLGVIGVEYRFGRHVFEGGHDVLAVDRSFYGVITVEFARLPSPSPAAGRALAAESVENVFMLVHGSTLHGWQYQNPRWKHTPTAYYGPRGGVGVAIEQHPLRDTAGRSFRVGAVGLGTGTVAAYARRGDVFVFYEINPTVIEFCRAENEETSRQWFSFVEDAQERGARVDIKLGDARMSLQREFSEGPGQNFDVLVVDAFSGDSIPAHLLTEECFEVYDRNLNASGVLAVHVSNRYLDLCPVVRSAAERYGWHCMHWVDFTDENNRRRSNSEWVLLARNETFVRQVRQRPEHRPFNNPNAPLVRWTDDHNSLFQILRF